MNHVYVHIIESPSSKDLLNSDCEGYILTQALRLIRIPHLYNLAVDESAFFESCKRILNEITANNKFPILHISAHGNKKGIQLTDKTFINWNKLRDILAPINDLLSNGLCMSIASCAGFYACIMAMDIDPKLPFFVLIGPTEDIPLADMAIGFVSFYHNFFTKRLAGMEAVNAMKIASGNQNFGIMLARDVKNMWIEKLSKGSFPKK